MKLGAILKSPANKSPIISRPVAFEIIGEGPDAAPFKSSVEAVFVPLSEDQREQALVEADAELAKKYQGQPVPAIVRVNSQTYHVLSKALRDAEPAANGYHASFADSAAELRSAIPMPVCRRLDEEYTRFLAEEFPVPVGDDEFNSLVDEVKKNSLSDLLSEFGYEKAVALLRHLASTSGSSATQT